MNSNEPNQDRHRSSLVEKHAMGRLHKVEKEKRKPYVKRPGGFSISQFVMTLLFLIILVVMLISIL